MKKLLVLMSLLLLTAAGRADGGTEDAVKYYDNAPAVFQFPMPEQISKLSYIKFTWQLIATPYGRVVAQGNVNSPIQDKFAKIQLEFEKLKPGIALKFLLQVKLNGKVILKQPVWVYSQKIFTGRINQAGAILPDAEYERLESLGLKLEKLSDFDNSAGPVFCEAKDYAENPDLFAALMKKQMTLIMFAPPEEIQIHLPVKEVRQITQIFAHDAKIAGTLGVISDKEQVLIDCSNGVGTLVDIQYKKGKIIIVSDALRKALTQEPDAALLLIEQLKPDNLKKSDVSEKQTTGE